MKPTIKLSLTLAGSVLAIGLVGCGTFGKNPAPPTKLESSIFDVRTNYVPVVVPVTSYRTNVVEVTATVTNLQGVTLTTTNWQTNTLTSTVTVTNLQPQYNYSPGATANTVAAGVSAIPVYGSLASAAIGGVLAIWGWLRSSKNAATAQNTTQVVEVLRNFIKQLPNGSAYDGALVQWMTQHQSEAGVLNNVMGILAADANNPDVQVAGQSVIAALQGLGINPSGQGTVTAAAKA